MSALLPPADIALLLRSHSEQRWLSREVIPVVRQIETGERLPEEQLPAAIAYLEVIWAEATALARAADTALGALEELGQERDEERGDRSRETLACGEHFRFGQQLAARARRYHAAVRALRAVLTRRVATAIAVPADYPETASNACSR
ncbi:MAG TPA: hypothetical protein VNV42_07290 [Solirubrobacteraceae bacterium]|jgi:hypothetical protein|nr:hypothetical protein [Solirubrobacteraceae bacterium]